MNWQSILDTFTKYWVQQLCALILCLITWQYHKRFKQYVKDQKSLKLAMMALLRDRFYQEYKRHIRNGFYPIRDREVMRDIYEQYHALGGNGVITHLKEELDELPTYPPVQP